MATDSISRRLAAACGLRSQYYAETTATPPVQEGRADAQKLTIFYGGTVMAIDGCKPEKAAELIRLAAAAAGRGATQRRPAPALVEMMPIAGNLSLRRFLSKRKERAIAATASVPGSGPAASYVRRDEESEPAAKKRRLEVSREEAASWLALGSLATMHAR